jgi:hypothetical protein
MSPKLATGFLGPLVLMQQVGSVNGLLLTCANQCTSSVLPVCISSELRQGEALTENSFSLTDATLEEGPGRTWV